MPDERFVLCIRNEGYEASLEPRKVYRLIADSQAESKGMLRVVDNSGEDYLFPSEYFLDQSSIRSQRCFCGRLAFVPGVVAQDCGARSNYGFER